MDTRVLSDCYVKLCLLVSHVLPSLHLFHFLLFCRPLWKALNKFVQLFYWSVTMQPERNLSQALILTSMRKIGQSNMYTMAGANCMQFCRLWHGDLDLHRANNTTVDWVLEWWCWSVSHFGLKMSRLWGGCNASCGFCQFSIRCLSYY